MNTGPCPLATASSRCKTVRCHDTRRTPATGPQETSTSVGQEQRARLRVPVGRGCAVAWGGAMRCFMTKLVHRRQIGGKFPPGRPSLPSAVDDDDEPQTNPRGHVTGLLRQHLVPLPCPALPTRSRVSIYRASTMPPSADRLVARRREAPATRRSGNIEPSWARGLARAEQAGASSNLAAPYTTSDPLAAPT